VTFFIDEMTLANFRKRYAEVHPLVFQRSLEKASSTLEFFEILQSVPADTPFSWDESKRSWARNEDIVSAEAVKSILKKKKG